MHIVKSNKASKVLIRRAEVINVGNKRDNESNVKEVRYKAYCLKITRKFSPVMSFDVKKKSPNFNVRNKRQTSESLRPLTSLLRNFAEREKRVTRAKNLWLDEARGCPDAAAALWNARFP